LIEQIRNKPIIINTDLDGLISGLILKKYLNCTIVGFSNSAEKFWLTNEIKYDLNDICFVDMFVANPSVLTIDQHIISANEKHHKLLCKNPNKINPNLMNPRYFLPNNSYYKKYPFGTVHFIIALLERSGINLDGLNFYNSSNNVSFIDLILRCDDAMKTSIASNYIKNASEWWSWLKVTSRNGVAISELIKYLSNTDKGYALRKKDQITHILQSTPFYCDSPDGGIIEILRGTKIKTNVLDYFEFVSEITGINLFRVDFDYKTFEGLAKRTSLSSHQIEKLINENTIEEQDIFSYAFVRSSSRDNSFSYTLKSKRNIK